MRYINISKNLLQANINKTGCKMLTRLPECSFKGCSHSNIEQNPDLSFPKNSYHLVETKQPHNNLKFSLPSDGTSPGSFVVAARVPERSSRKEIDTSTKNMIKDWATSSDFVDKTKKWGKTGVKAVGKSFSTHTPDCDISKTLKSLAGYKVPDSQSTDGFFAVDTVAFGKLEI